MVRLSIKEIIGSETAVSPRKGLMLYEKLKSIIESGDNKIIISFSGIEDLVTAFTNASFGRLYLEFPKSDLDSRLEIEGASDIWTTKINQAIRLATNEAARTTHSNSIDGILDS